MATLPHVLIVEDNANASGALRVLFEATGHRVTVAETVREATSVIQADVPDLVLLDLTLPDGDGFSVIPPQLADTGSAKRPVFVALTGHDDPEIARRAIELGCAQVLVKPVPARMLIDLAGKWLATRD